MKMSPNYIYNQEDLVTVLKSVDENHLVVIQVKSAWCKESLKNEPEMFNLSLRYQNVATFYKFNAEMCSTLRTILKAQELPAVIIFKNKNIVQRIAGSDPAVVDETVRQLIPETAGDVPEDQNSPPEEQKPAEQKEDNKSSSSSSWFKNFGWPSWSKRKAEGDAASVSAKPSNPKSPKLEATPDDPPPSLEEAVGVIDYMPKTVIQITLADGTRLTAQLNIYMPISKIREYILLAKPQYSNKKFELVGPPNIGTIQDESVTIQDANLEKTSLKMRIIVQK